jgi:glycerol kinase
LSQSLSIYLDFIDIINDLLGTITLFFIGLYAPHWQPMARCALVGMNQYTYRESILKAAMESVSFQSQDILEAMRLDSKAPLDHLKVDGYLSTNKTIMQSLSNITNARVEVATNNEMAELGVAMAAGYTAEINVWNALCMPEDVGKTYESKMKVDEREKRIYGWKKALRSSFNWIGFKKPADYLWTVAPVATAGILLLGMYLITK